MMKCTEKPDVECNNKNLKKCITCEGNMWCCCQRPEVRKMVKDLWKKANTKEKDD